MKAIFLNCWYGKLGDKLLEFLKSHTSTTDVYCLQEVSVTLEKSIDGVLLNYNKISNRESKNINLQNQITYARKDYVTESIKDLFISVKLKEQNVYFVNIHQEAEPGHKLDTKDRINFSKNIIDFVSQKENVIIGGDFNLMPRTKSIKMLEEKGFKNLIKQFSIRKTRNKHAWNQAVDLAKNTGLPFYGKQRYSDYCFVSNSIPVKSFEVPDVEVSDHSPLILEI